MIDELKLILSILFLIKKKDALKIATKNPYNRFLLKTNNIPPELITNMNTIRLSRNFCFKV
tara:strand:+ start:286 stop:468 length:183 start_codon:yes stop_codon:yes gene_type:complete